MTLNISKNNLPERELVEKYLSGTTHYYTLYPTQSNWEKSKDVNFFIENLDIAIKEDVNFSLYIHFPFCPKQCYFCHCYTVISKKQDHYKEIVQTIIKELKNLFNLIYKRSGKNKIKKPFLILSSPSFKAFLRADFGLFLSIAIGLRCERAQPQKGIKRSSFFKRVVRGKKKY